MEDTTRLVVKTELPIVPSDVQYVVVTYCWVSSATSADVIVVAEKRVERSMVLLPTMTRLLDLPDSVRTIADGVAAEAGAAVLVTMLEVIVLPDLSVVVIGIVVLIVVDD